MIYKTIFSLLLMCFSCTFSAYSQLKPKIKHGPFVENDTTFLLKKYYPGYTQSIFIEKNKDSGFYKRLLNFKLNDYAVKEFEDYINSYIKKNPGSIQKHELYNLPTEWVPLYLYQGEYYLYSPSEGGFNGRRQLTPSILTCHYLDGPRPFIISSVKRLSPVVYHIKTTDAIANSDLLQAPENLYIYIVDPANEIAVWQYTDNAGKPFYKLYVSTKKARQFNMIAWDSRHEKEFDEFKFDQINFKKLIEQCKNKP